MMIARLARLRMAAQHFGVLLIALTILLATLPLLEDRPYWDVFVAMFADLVLIACLYAARPGDGSVKVGVALAIADFAIGRIASATSTPWLVVPQLLIWLSILLFVAITILRVVFQSKKVTIETLMASLCVLLLLGLIWTFVYVFVEMAMPHAFHSQSGRLGVWADDHARRAEFTRLLVFSFTTLSGAVGGDLAPAISFATMLASLEAMMGQIYMAVVIARLVGMQSVPSPPDPTVEDAQEFA